MLFTKCLVQRHLVNVQGDTFPSFLVMGVRAYWKQQALGWGKAWKICEIFPLFHAQEVRHLLQGPLETGLRHLETFAPGDALLDRSNSMWMVRMAAAPR